MHPSLAQSNQELANLSLIHSSLSPLSKVTLVQNLPQLEPNWMEAKRGKSIHHSEKKWTTLEHYPCTTSKRLVSAFEGLQRRQATHLQFGETQTAVVSNSELLEFHKGAQIQLQTHGKARIIRHNNRLHARRGKSLPFFVTITNEPRETALQATNVYIWERWTLPTVQSHLLSPSECFVGKCHICQQRHV